MFRVVLGILSKLSPVSYCCGWHKFINPSYAFFCLSNFILYAWYDVMYVYLVDYSEKDLVPISKTFLLRLSLKARAFSIANSIC